MRAAVAVVVGLLVSSSGLAGAPYAQPGSPGAHPRYDPSTVETVAGKVVAVRMQVSPRGGGYGVHLQLRTKTETVAVLLGPSWYLERQDTHLQEGDEVEVRGSRITYEGAPAIVAAEIERGAEILHLRDAEGFPVWAGWRRRGGGGAGTRGPP